MGWRHSATIRCYREVKNQRPLFGDELEEMSVAFRPNPAVGLFVVRTASNRVKPSPRMTCWGT